MKKVILMLIGLSMISQTRAQNKILTMEDAILGRHLIPTSKYLQWQGNKDNITYLYEKDLVCESVKSDEKITILTLSELNNILGTKLEGFPNFNWIDDNTIMIAREGKAFHINVDEKNITSTFTFPKGSTNYTYTKNGERYAYTIDNNLFVVDKNNHVTAITKDTDKNIVNGQSVSRNEFGIKNGIFWSPDGNKLGYYRKDESHVTSFPLLDITTRTGSLVEIKYPMAGMDSEIIQLGVYDFNNSKTTFMNVDEFGKDQYLTNISWEPTSQAVYIQVLNREQNLMRLNRYDIENGQKLATLFEESSNTYVEPLASLIFFANKPDQFIYQTNCRDGYINLYLYNTSGKFIKRLTRVDADVEFVSMDPAGKFVYYLSSEISPVEKHLFKVDVKSGKATRLSNISGWHTINMNNACTHYIDNYTSVKIPRNIDLYTNTGKLVRQLHEAPNPQIDYNFGEITLGKIQSFDGSDLYYRLIKPIDFDASKKYPVIQYVYGGPHSQMVRNTWNAQLRMWEMYMAQRGYVVFVIDNHGTQNQGKTFEESIHLQCGQLEMKDQVAGIEFLKSYPWVDANRIGVHGWSYGGFMTISLMTNYPEIYKVGVAGGPVIDWKWYEIMYGERYMSSPQNNPEGYEKTSLINKAKDLKGKLLICQGAIDPVVVWEHSLSFIQECIKNNVQVDYFPYPRAEHNVMGKDRVHLMQKVTNYFEDYLK